MKFSFEESELINTFAEDVAVVPTKNDFIERIVLSGSDNEDPELTAIANSTITKLRVINDHTFSKMLANLPVDTYTHY